MMKGFGLSTKESVDGKRKEIKEHNNQGISDTVEMITYWRWYLGGWGDIAAPWFAYALEKEDLGGDDCHVPSIWSLKVLTMLKLLGVQIDINYSS